MDQNKLKEIKNNLDLIKGVMVENIGIYKKKNIFLECIIDREEKIELLVKKTEKMQHLSIEI